ncbi:MAG TPA: aspartate-semialdehyde dehydrogenase [Candidatus Scatomorpha pullistercoris]|uniref:Aspartate-semialdehyde dehydrogenase n=1 Tax=Candidatus Scatomorpha pullistercoris TaxID=2840929 RepID=A0A9D1G3L3_9FIRM|nr:aspartate-semialdehyde dehydrogenase [Candidatus Scatomorpha pullistercoris]
MEKLRAGIIGGTGMVGQRYVTLIADHPWFELSVIAASARSAGKTYEEAVGAKWALDDPMPECAKKMVVRNAADVADIVKDVDFVFSAVDMKKEDILALEEEYAKAECPVVSNNSANRWTPDVPMVIPEINADHLAVIADQKKRLGTKRGFIAVKSNCSIQSYVPALSPFRADFGLNKILVCTYQAISGAGKTFKTWPDMVDNVIPYIGGEEEKSEQEPMKVWGRVEDGVIKNAEKPLITAQCLRVAASNGHMAAVFVSFDKKPSMDEMKARWAAYKGRAQELELPSAPKQFLRYFEEPDRPQTRLDRMNEGGMQISIGRLRPDTHYDYKFVCLSHNTLRGAAGGAVELAELLRAEGYITAK